METIRWSKKYHEDLGTQDSKGFYDYAYTYFIYWFILPNNGKIKVRQYTDTADEYSLFVSYNELKKRTDPESRKKKDSIDAIINFLRTKHGISKFRYFNGSYNSINLSQVNNDLSDFLFSEEEGIE